MLNLKKLLEPIKYNLILFILIPIALILPDFLSKIFNENNHAALSGKFLLGLLGFALFLAFCRRSVAFLVLGLLMIIELIQFCHLFYYGSLITSAKFRLLFEDFGEVWQVVGEAASFLYFVPLLVLVPYAIVFYCFNKLESKRYKSFLAAIPVILVLAIIPFRVNQAYGGINYYPDPADHSLRNSLYAATNAIFNFTNPKTYSQVEYQDYKIEQSPTWSDEKVNVILIIGEGVNLNHMSLFGYERNTSPLLSSLKTDSNFIYLPGISGGVSTVVSTPLLINGIYEPNNYKALEEKKANLFKLAKQHGFKNFYISAQTGALLTNLGSENIDYTVFRKKEAFLFDRYQDEALLKIVEDLDYSDRNFVVINQRNAHAPYESNYQHDTRHRYFPVSNKGYQEFLVDTYDNAMIYNDFIIYHLIDYFRHRFRGPTYIIFTSDHGEGLGPIYGHSIVDRQVAEIPFLAYIVNAEKPKLQGPVCHYEVNNLVASALGFKIINPNLKPGICYIQGTNLYGLNEYMEITK